MTVDNKRVGGISHYALFVAVNQYEVVIIIMRSLVARGAATGYDHAVNCKRIDHHDFVVRDREAGKCKGWGISLLILAR